MRGFEGEVVAAEYGESGDVEGRKRRKGERIHGDDKDDDSRRRWSVGMAGLESGRQSNRKENCNSLYSLSATDAAERCLRRR